MGCPVLDSEYYGSLARKSFCFLPNDGRPRTVETKILGKTVNKKYFVFKAVGDESVEIEEEAGKPVPVWRND